MHGKVEGYGAVTSIIGEHMCGGNDVMGAYGWAIGTYGALSAAVAITNFPEEAGKDAGAALHQGLAPVQPLRLHGLVRGQEDLGADGVDILALHPKSGADGVSRLDESVYQFLGRLVHGVTSCDRFSFNISIYHDLPGEERGNRPPYPSFAPAAEKEKQFSRKSAVLVYKTCRIWYS
jgi:hypothetical protein